MKLKADAGVKMSASIVQRALPSEDPAITAKVLTTDSLEAIPQSRAAAALRSPKPKGLKSGSKKIPICARRLLSMLFVNWREVSRF